MSAQAQTILQALLHNLGFAVTIREQNLEDGLLLDVQTPDATALIGRQGQTLSDLQYLTNRILFRLDPSAPKVTVDIGGYRAQAREVLVKRRTPPPTRSAASGTPWNSSR